MEYFWDLFLPARRVAAHEAGHTLLAWMSPYVTVIHRVSLDLGVTVFSARPKQTAEFVFDTAVIHLAGLAGEEASFGDFHDSPSSTDLLGALRHAEALPKYPGWVDCVSRARERYAPHCSLNLAAVFPRRLSLDTRIILNVAHGAALGQILEFRAAHERLTQALIQKRNLDPGDIAMLMGPRFWVC
jgi:ATP-dependent Zn protease